MPGIEVQAVSKRFRRYVSDRPYTLQEAFLHGFRNLRAASEFWALQDVSLQVQAGEMVGVIGRNGAGKSTLLRLVGGIGEPERGRITVDGRLGALIELGAGYHPELTGRENIFMNGVISGYTRREVSAILDDIVEFAELRAFIDNPVRTYSSGMQLRLAFSVAVHVQPEVLLVDEVLAVGDLGFQRKCLERIDALRAAGVAILYVTHDLAQAEQRCSRLVWLDGGQVVAWGGAAEVVAAYRLAVQSAAANAAPTRDSAESGAGRLQMNINRFGTQAVTLGDVRLCDGDGQPTDIVYANQSLTVRMGWQFSAGQAVSLNGIQFSVGIHSADGQLLFEQHLPVGKLPDAAGRVALHFARLDLAPGSYFIDVGVYSADWATTYDYHWRVHCLTVAGTVEAKGPLLPPSRWEVTSAST